MKSVNLHKGKEARRWLDFLVTAKLFSILSQFNFEMSSSLLHDALGVFTCENKEKSKSNSNSDAAATLDHNLITTRRRQQKLPAEATVLPQRKHLAIAGSSILLPLWQNIWDGQRATGRHPWPGLPQGWKSEVVRWPSHLPRWCRHCVDWVSVTEWHGELRRLAVCRRSSRLARPNWVTEQQRDVPSSQGNNTQ